MASSIEAIPTGSDRQFGTELSANVPSLARLTTSTPRSLLKRPAPSFYKDRHTDDYRSGKKARTLDDFFETMAMSPLHRENGWNIVDLGGLKLM